MSPAEVAPPDPAPAPGPVPWGRALAAALATGTGPGAALLLRALAEAVRFRHLGRETTLRLGEGAVRFVPTVLDVPLGARALVTGRLDEVRLRARDVTGPGLALREVTVLASGVHLRIAPVPELVGGPVAVTAVLDPSWLAGRVRAQVPDLDVAVDDDGVLRARWRRRPGLAAAEVAVDVDGDLLTWRITGVSVAGRRLGPPRSAAGRRSARAVLDRGPLRGHWSGAVALAGLPHGLRLTGVAVAPGAVTVRGVLPSWRHPVPSPLP